MSEPFLSIITRHMPSRPKMLERNVDSLRGQTDQNFQHNIYTDHMEQGCHKAQQWNRELVQQQEGRYIMILDDDDYMVNPEGVRLLKAACASNPRGVVFRAEYRPDHILPKSFERFPTQFWPMSCVGQLCYILRNDVFKHSSYVYRRGVDETDYLCILDAWETSKRENALSEWVVVPEVINAAQRPDSRGRPE